jgi:hypothetical protein
MGIEGNIEKINALIDNANLVAVTKTRTIEEIREAINSGIKIIAENRIKEAEDKYNLLKDFLKKHNTEFHFIGHLQTNKAKKAVNMFNLIQSLDSLRLAEEIDKRAKSINKIQNVLVQVNIGKEEQKYGVMPEKTADFVNRVKQMKNIMVKGLMCMPPLLKDAENTRPYFRKMKAIFQKQNLEILSMGMSNDYRIAVEEGSNMIRIGRAIFGKY